MPLAILGHVSIALTLTLGAAVSFSTACRADDAPSEPATITMALEEGELFSVISVVPRAGETAAQARKTYAGNAFGLASEYGLRPFGALRVTEVIVGEFEPKILAFYAWPSAQAETLFNEDPHWPPIKATRPDGWDELRIHDAVAKSSVTLEFSADKFYTLASAWIDPQQPDDYDRYLKNIEPAVSAEGGRFLYQMVDPNFVALDGATTAPGRLTLVEWESEAGLDAFLESEGYRQNSSLVRSGTTQFEVLALSVPPK